MEDRENTEEPAVQSGGQPAIDPAELDELVVHRLVKVIQQAGVSAPTEKKLLAALHSKNDASAAREDKPGSPAGRSKEVPGGTGHGPARPDDTPVVGI